MRLECPVLGKDVEITDTTVPVISPYWRLKRNGSWTVLLRYDQEQFNYSMLSPLVGAALSLMDGRLTFRHLTVMLQYSHGFESPEKAQEFLIQVITSVNKECDAIVAMTAEMEPYLQKLDPLQFLVTDAQWKEQKRPAAPLSLNLMFSNDCASDCTYCRAHRRYVPENELLPTKRWQELLREAKSLGIEQVTLSGGDPLFRRDALALIAELIKLDMLFLLSTRCCITEEIADSLVDIGMTRPINQYVREIQLAIDGPDEQAADKSAGSPGDRGKTLQSIRNLLDRRFNLRVKAVVTPLSTPHIYPWIKQLVEMGVTRILVAAYNMTCHGHDGSLPLSVEDRILLARQCERARMEFPHIDLDLMAPRADMPVAPAALGITGDRPVDAGKEMIRHGQEPAQGPGSRSSMTITPDGKVVLCDTVPQKELSFVGDVSQRSMLEVWNSREFIDFAYPPREKFKGSACYDCQELEECQSKVGYCFRDSFFNYGAMFRPPPKCPMGQDAGLSME